MKIVVTGGHFSPAYSIILKLKENNDILVIGRKTAFGNDLETTFEYKICQKLNIQFRSLTTAKLERNLGMKAFRSFSKFPKGVFESIKILKNFSPEVVVTFGGYIGLPVAIAAKILGIPIIVHEQTQKAGLSARIISNFASVILISFDSSRRYFPNKKVILTGNPLRPEFFNNNHSKFSIKSPSIYITGGSTGSHFINSKIEKILPELSRYQIFHQTGNATEFNDYERLKKLASDNYIVSDFFEPDEVFELFEKVDLVISRSGINTVCELIASSAVSLLIPLSVGQKNEQVDNALYVKKLGGGEFILQEDVTPQKLLDLINDMIKKKKSYKEELKAAKKDIIFDSAERIIAQIYLWKKKKIRGQKDI